jgi:photosystem II stability/assembly factor-like uncharacterized protein
MKGSHGNKAPRVSTLFVWATALCMVAMTPGPVWAAIDAWTSLGPEGGSIYAISIDPRDPNTLYAGTALGSSFTSRDAGRSWMKFAVPYPTLVFDLQNPNVIYARPQRYYVGPLLKSTDQGKNWRDISPQRKSVSDFVISFQDSNTMFVAADGVFKSTDAGESWRAVNAGFSSGHLLKP